MKLHLLFINVQSINYDHKLGVIGDYLGSLSSEVEILCLQKHKLRSNNLDGNIRMLWRRVDFWSLEASLSNEIEDKRLEVAMPCVSILDCIHSFTIEVLLLKTMFNGLDSKG